MQASDRPSQAHKAKSGAMRSVAKHREHRCRGAISGVFQTCNRNGLSPMGHTNRACSSGVLPLRRLLNCAVVGLVSAGHGGA